MRKRFLRLINVYVTSAEGEQLMKRNRVSQLLSDKVFKLLPHFYFQEKKPVDRNQLIYNHDIASLRHHFVFVEIYMDKT